MAITLSSVTVVQGTGTYFKESVLEVAYTLTATSGNAGHAFDVEAQVSLTGSHSPYVANTWVTAHLHPDQSNAAVQYQNISAGTHKVIVRVPLTLDQGSIPRANYTAELKVQLRAKDLTTGEYSAWLISSASDLKAALPTVTSAAMAHYIGNVGATVPYNNVPVTISGDAGAAIAHNPYFYLVSQNPLDLSDGVGTPLTYVTSFSFAFAYSDTDGEKSVLVRTYDQYYNGSALKEISYDGTDGHRPWLQKALPSKLKVRIVGTAGNEEYTGISRDGNGHFVPDRTAKLHISAQSGLGMTFKVLTTSNVELLPKLFTDPLHPLFNDPLNAVGQVIPYNTANNVAQVTLTTNQATPAMDNFNQDASVTVAVEIKDLAGNTLTVSPANPIRLNTRIYRVQSAHTPLRPADSLYRPVLREVGTSGSETTIPERFAPTDYGQPPRTLRMWNDIFYPPSHGYPADEFGILDETAAIALQGTSTAAHDAVVLVTNGTTSTVAKDEEGRCLTSHWTTDGTKNYTPMLSSAVSNRVAWVLDNQRNGDYRLEFEWFDLNPNAYGPPFNALAPHRGDVLVVYDATATGALTATEDPATGLQQYTIADASKLVEIAAYTGSGTNVVNLTTQGRMNSNSQGGFTSDWIRGIPQVVLILYTDAAGNASGFKLKGGKQYEQACVNVDTDAATGELWIHKYPPFGTVPGAADATVKHLICDYLNNKVQVDPYARIITFAADPGGVVTADFTTANYLAYTGTDWTTTTFLASEDDLVVYQEASLYVLPAAQYALTDDIRQAIYDPTAPTTSYGRVVGQIAWNTDAGMVGFDTLGDIPLTRRLCAEYGHHTYKRITDDGYGDLTFADPTLVADQTPAYPDYTSADIRISNEGDALLEGPKLIFTPRGYDTDGQDGVLLDPVEWARIKKRTYTQPSDIVDQVFNLDRPWDIQHGTASETYTKVACAIATSYVWTRGCPRDGDSGPNAQSASGIYAAWVNQPFGIDLPPRGQVYGRVVWFLQAGGSYPTDVSAGSKRCSMEIDGHYYIDSVG